MQRMQLIVITCLRIRTECISRRRVGLQDKDHRAIIPCIRPHIIPCIIQWPSEAHHPQEHLEDLRWDTIIPRCIRQSQCMWI